MICPLKYAVLGDRGFKEVRNLECDHMNILQSNTTRILKSLKHTNLQRKDHATVWGEIIHIQTKEQSFRRPTTLPSQSWTSHFQVWANQHQILRPFFLWSFVMTALEQLGQFAGCIHFCNFSCLCWNLLGHMHRLSILGFSLAEGLVHFRIPSPPQWVIREVAFQSAVTFTLLFFC